jgi:hypothetical protein
MTVTAGYGGQLPLYNVLIIESESDGNVSGEPPPDQRLTRRDIHSLNEQRRRDQIKVICHSVR